MVDREREVTEGLTELLGSHGTDVRDIEALVGWAHERARDLVVGLNDDPELGPLLHTGALPPPPPPHAVAEHSHAPVPSLDATPSASDEGEDDEDEGEVDEVDEDEVEMLDDDDLELVEPEPGDGSADQADALGESTVPEWKAALDTAQGESQPGFSSENLPTQPHSRRWVGEDEEISRHDIDLSDFDGDPAARES